MIVDDHPMLRAGLAAILRNEPDFEICGEAAGTAEALGRIGKAKPDLMIVDLSLEEGSGIDLIHEIRSVHGEIKVLVCSMHSESLYAERALQAGASGFINKKEAAVQVVEAIRAVLKGKVYLSEEMSDRILLALAHKPQRASTPMDGLSNREMEIFQGIGEGLSTKEMAQKLHLSVKTIETYHGRIKSKLGLKDHPDLIRNATRWIAELGKGEN